MTEEYKIPVYKDLDVSAEAKRLAMCFNIVAGSSSGREPDLVIREGLHLYQLTTGEKNLPNISPEEKPFIQTQFLKIAARMYGDQNPGWSSLEEELFKKVKNLEKEAIKQGLKI